MEYFSIYKSYFFILSLFTLSIYHLTRADTKIASLNWKIHNFTYSYWLGFKTRVSKIAKEKHLRMNRDHMES